MSDVAPCTRLHPDWRAGEEYASQRELHGAWTVAGSGLYARHVDHAQQAVDGFVRFAPGAVVRYIGSHYEYEDSFEGAFHIFQLLDSGPGWDPPKANELLAPVIGDCYESWEYIDDATLGRWWKGTLVPAVDTFMPQ